MNIAKLQSKISLIYLKHTDFFLIFKINSNLDSF